MTINTNIYVNQTISSDPQAALQQEPPELDRLPTNAATDAITQTDYPILAHIDESLMRSETIPEAGSESQLAHELAMHMAGSSWYGQWDATNFQNSFWSADPEQRSATDGVFAWEGYDQTEYWSGDLGKLVFSPDSSLHLDEALSVSGVVNQVVLHPIRLLAGHKNLFSLDGRIKGGFRIGNDTGRNIEGQAPYSQCFYARVQGYDVVVRHAAGGPYVVVAEEILLPGRSVGPVTFADDRRVVISAMSEESGSKVIATVSIGSTGKGLSLTLAGFEGIEAASGALVHLVQQQPAKPF